MFWRVLRSLIFSSAQSYLAHSELKNFLGFGRYRDKPLRANSHCELNINYLNWWDGHRKRFVRRIEFVMCAAVKSSDEGL